MSFSERPSPYTSAVSRNVTPGVDGGAQHLQRGLVGHRPPVRAELPAPQPDDPDRPTRTSQQPALHGQGRYPARTMGRVTSIPIDAVVRSFPVDAATAWGLVADLRNHERWIPLTRVSLDGPAAAGATVTAVSGPFARRGFPGLADVMTRRPLRPAGRRGAGRRDVHQDRARAQGPREHRRRPRRTVVEPRVLERERLPGRARSPADSPARCSRPFLGGMVRYALLKARREARATDRRR